jgi:CRP/FNR family nitrogen fixation transcriptional regulator
MYAFAATAVARQTRVPVGVLAKHTPTALSASSNNPRAIDALRYFAKGDEVFAEGGSSEFFYKVVSGTMRTSKLLRDGRRQIDAFHLAGDIFGLESGEEHPFTAEAVDDVVVLALRRGHVTSLLHDNPVFGDELMSSIMSNLDRAHDHMVLLGRKTAQEKLATFLLDMADRLTQDDAAHDCFDLPMQRNDIADHLGLTIETVSRMLTQMARKGLIKFVAAGRTIILSDRAGLQHLNA